MPLSDLAAALAAATGPDRALDVMLAGLVFYRQPLTGGWSGIDEPWAAEDIAVALEGEHTIKVPAYTSDLKVVGQFKFSS